VVGLVVGCVAFALSLALGIAGIVATIAAERVEIAGEARTEVRGFRDVVDRLGLGQRLVVVGLVAWGSLLSSPVWLLLGLRSLLALIA